MIVHVGLQNWEAAFFQEKLDPILQAKQSKQIFIPSLQELDQVTKTQTEVLTVFVHHKLGAEDLEQFTKLKLICTRSTGFDHLDLNYCQEKGIQVCNVPSYGENTVAEFTFALLLALVRKIPQVYQRVQNYDFSYEDLKGVDLKGKVLGLYGAGRIGLHVAKIAKGFGMQVLVYDIFKQPFLTEVLDFQYTDLDHLLSTAQILSLHVPYSAQTKNIIDKKVFAKLPNGAILVNTARGGLVNNRDLLEVLESDKLAGVVLDTIDGEKELFALENEKKLTEDLQIAKKIITHPKVVFTPHMAYYTQEAQERILQTTLENVSNYLQGENLGNLVKI